MIGLSFSNQRHAADVHIGRRDRTAWPLRSQRIAPVDEQNARMWTGVRSGRVAGVSRSALPKSKLSLGFTSDAPRCLNLDRDGLNRREAVIGVPAPIAPDPSTVIEPEASVTLIMTCSKLLSFISLAATALAHANHDQTPIAGPLQALWYNTLPGDGGTQADSVFSGISTFGRLPYFPCLASDEVKYDIAFIGAPFDTGTSYRPGARFGPSGIRQGSRRLNLYGGYNVPLEANPFNSWATVLDCGDIPVTSYDNTWALHQIEEGHNSILTRAPKTDADKAGPAKKGKTLPRVITLGGDHTITLPLLRSVNRAYGPISVIHFDSHLDTWKPKVFGGSPTKIASVNHGTYFYHASQEGLLANDTNIHAGIRTTLSGPSDYENDGYCGFEIVEAREIDTIGTEGIIKKIKERVGTTKPVYLSIDIDTLDPAFAPATGTPETGGWSTRELRTILRGLTGINLVAADIVEVAPAYDTNAELTTMAAADTLYEVMTLMVMKGPLSKMFESGAEEL